MGPERRRFVWLRNGLALALAASSVPATAQIGSPRRRPQPPPAARPADNALDNAIGQNTTGDASQPVAASARRPVALPPAPPMLRSALHSRFSRPAVIARSTTGQCRVQCAEARNTCANGQGDTTGCDPGWTQCLSTCAGLGYSRGP